MVLIGVYDHARKLVGQCDGICHDAIGTSCHCVCGGILHSAARRGVLEPTYRRNFLAIVEHVALNNPDCHLHFAPSQLELWPDEGQAAPP